MVLKFVELVPAVVVAAVAVADAADTVATFVVVAFCEWPAAELSPITFDEISLLFELDEMFDVC